MRVPAGAPLARVWGVRGRALSHPRLPALRAGCRGPARLCVCVPCLAGSGVPASRAGFGAPHLSFGRSWFAVCLFGPLRAGVAPFVVVVGFFFCCSLSSSPPLLGPRCVLLCVFSGPGCLAPWRLVPPPAFFFPCPPSVRPVVSALRGFWPGVPRALASCRPPSPLFFAPPPFFFLPVVCFLPLRVCCVCSGVSCCVFPVLPVRCAVRVVCAVSGGWCCWLLVSLPFVGGLLVALVARRCRLVVCVSPGARVWSGRRWASSLWCPVPLSCVLWRCAAVWCCAVVPCLLLFFSPCWWRWFPVVPRWSFAPGRFRVVSVSVLCLCGAVLVCLRRCSLFGALLPSRGWLVFCVVARCVCVFAVGPGCPLLSPGGSWWLLVSCLGGVLWCVPGCLAAPCCCALCRLALRCCALCCFVLFCLVLPRAVLCPGALSSSWGPVPSGAVFCLVPPRCVCFAVVCRCVVLFAVVLCAVCALGCRVVRFLSSPPCAVLLCGPLSLGALLPCAVPRGAVLPRGAVVSCPAALLGLFSAWVWLYLLEKPHAKFRKIFLSSPFGFRK